MHILANSARTTKTLATIEVLERAGRVLFSCDGVEIECSTKTAIFELKRTNRTLADIRLVDIDQAHRGDMPPSRQCVAVRDALLDAGLPDPVFTSLSK